jgi:hypothetical protein
MPAFDFKQTIVLAVEPGLKACACVLYGKVTARLRHRYDLPSRQTYSPVGVADCRLLHFRFRTEAICNLRPPMIFTLFLHVTEIPCE